METPYPITTAPDWDIPILTDCGIAKRVTIITEGRRSYWILCMPDGFPIMDEAGYRKVYPQHWCYLPEWVTRDFGHPLDFSPQSPQ